MHLSRSLLTSSTILIFQYRAGNVGIILSIPHGGLRDDHSIPERRDGYEIPNNLQDINVSYWKILIETLPFTKCQK